ncbi:response regulator [Geobacter sp.]|uniref:response regulator n=1 Tax=Geobacter sp. TaxID=46610 RepID=UPI0026179691|nr:response regulator [Geobacter sp.]
MKRVLVIEDNRDNLRLIGYALRRSGYSVESAETGEEGVRKARECLPSFIIVDINLPDIDGFEVTRRIKEAEATAGIPIVAITSHAMVGDRERIIASGCRGYFEKPLDPLTIVEKIHDLLGADHEDTDR